MGTELGKYENMRCNGTFSSPLSHTSTAYSVARGRLAWYHFLLLSCLLSLIDVDICVPLTQTMVPGMVSFVEFSTRHALCSVNCLDVSFLFARAASQWRQK